jgi:hypothetical protein
MSDADSVSIHTPRGVLGGNTLDLNNSTTTELGRNAQYKGAWVDVTAFSGVLISLTTQNIGTLYTEWTTDETSTGDFDAEFSEQFDNPGKAEFMFRYNHRARYFRVRYLNNGFAQTSFVLQVFHGKFNAATDAQRLRGKEENTTVDVIQKDRLTQLATSDTQVRNLLQNISDEMEKQTALLEQILE